MPALASPSTWRTHPYRYIPYLYIDRPETVFAARVNQASFTYPLVAVTFDTVTTGAFGDIEVGQTVLFGTSAGADDLGRQRIRKAATSTVLYFGESSTGDHDGEVILTDNAYITVLNDRRIWAVHPRYVEGDPPVAYKDYEIEVDSGGRNYATDPGPKANGGCWRAGLVNTGTGLVTFSFTDESLAITPSSTIASRVWDVQDGTITVGTSTSASITATFPVGRRYITLTSTDSNGDTDVHYILVVGLSLTDVTWKPIRNFEITDQRYTREGGSMAVSIYEDISYATYYDGVAVIYFEIESYNDTVGSLAGPTSAEGVKLVGWLDIERENPHMEYPTGLHKGTELSIISTYERLRQIVLLPQLLKNKSAPDEWDEILTLTTPRLLWYLLRWHSTALSVSNLLYPDGLGSAIKRWGTTATDLAAQCQETAKARGQVFTCDQRGILRLLENPNLPAAADRPSTVIVALVNTDYEGYGLERRRAPEYYWIDGQAITLGTDNEDILALYAIAPGDAPGQGAQRSVFSGLIVTDQTELNVWTGNEYARLNAPYLPLSLQMANTGDAGIDPALMEWVTLTIASGTNRRARAFTTQRFLPTEVTIAPSNDRTKTKSVELSLQIETEGEPATTRIIENGAGTSQTVIIGSDLYPIVDYNPPAAGVFGLYAGIKKIAAFCSDRNVYITSNFDSPSPTWLQVSLGVASDVDDFVVNAFSPGYLGTGININGWFCTKVGIYEIVDIFNNGTGRTITLKHTFANATPAAMLAQLDSQFGASGYITCIQHVTGTNIRCVHSENNGAAWTNTTITTFRYTGAATGIFTDVFASTRVAGLVYGTGFYGANDLAFLARSTDYGATWAQVSPTGDAGVAPILCLHIPWHDNPTQTLVYYGYFDATDFNLRRITAGSTEESTITPTVGGDQVGPEGHWGLTSHVSDRRRMAMVGINAAATIISLLTSLDGGTTWTEKQRLASRYRACFIAGDNGNVLYLWGSDGRIGYSQDFGSTVLDKRGNIPTAYPSIGRIMRICGGPE